MASSILLLNCVLLSLWNIADANVQESLELRVFDRDVQISDNEMMIMLQIADLESHGFKKEIIRQFVSGDSGNAKHVYEKRFRFLKTIECSRLREIDQELNRLIPGIFGIDLVERINKEINTKHLDGFTKCKAGLEVHFKNGRSCDDFTRVSKRRKRAACDTPLQESLELRVFDRDVQMSDDEMMETLRKSDLERHGYKKERISQLVSSDSGNAKPVYEKRFQFLKMIECSRLREIDQELNMLIPGIFGIDLVKRINTKHLDGFTKCQAGLEVHFGSENVETGLLVVAVSFPSYPETI